MEKDKFAEDETRTTEPKTEKPSIGQRLSAFTVKQWVLFGIVAFTAIFMLIGPAFPVVHVSLEVYGAKVMESTVLGYDILVGYMPKALESVAAMLMAFVWLQMIATIACLVLTVLSLTVFSQKTARRAQLAVMIVSTVFAFLYMIDGIAAISASELYVATTAAYALFIVVALLMVGYVVCLKVLPETAAPKRAKEARRSVQSESDIAAQLKQYKELFDMGAITEEEYLKKKSELLNG